MTTAMAEVLEICNFMYLPNYFSIMISVIKIKPMV